jgi:hypothetical protein
MIRGIESVSINHDSLDAHVFCDGNIELSLRVNHRTDPELFQLVKAFSDSITPILHKHLESAIAQSE